MKNVFDAITGLRYDVSAKGNIYTASFIYILSKAFKFAKLNALPSVVLHMLFCLNK